MCESCVSRQIIGNESKTLGKLLGDPAIMQRRATSTVKRLDLYSGAQAKPRFMKLFGLSKVEKLSQVGR